MWKFVKNVARPMILQQQEPPLYCSSLASPLPVVMARVEDSCIKMRKAVVSKIMLPFRITGRGCVCLASNTVAIYSARPPSPLALLSVENLGCRWEKISGCLITMYNAFKEHSSQPTSNTFLHGSVLIHFTHEQLRKNVPLVWFYRLRV